MISNNLKRVRRINQFTQEVVAEKINGLSILLSNTI